MSKNLTFSVEIFPPRSDIAWAGLRQTVRSLEVYAPEFISVTYGAGGTTRQPTLDAVDWLVKNTSIPVAGHLTCVGATRAQTDTVIEAYQKAGARRVVALRGDPPEGPDAPYLPHPQGYRSTACLVRKLAGSGFDVSVSAYPEKHPHSRDLDADIDVLAEKVDAGAARAITQFFFDNADFYRFRDRVAARGIDIDIVPGVLPIGSFRQVSGFAAKCGAKVPDALAQRFAGLDDDKQTHDMVAAAVAAEQIDDLSHNGVSEFHFYTLNRAELTMACCRMLGLNPVDLNGKAA